MSDELKACPFCGKMPRENSVTLPFDVGGRRKIAQCACGAFLYTGRWNTRPIEAELQQRIDELTAELTALREQVRWIPVSEKLPKDNQEVLIYADLIAKGVHSTKSRQWSADGYYYHGDWYDTVTHWMPLPLPPEEK